MTSSTHTGPLLKKGRAAGGSRWAGALVLALLLLPSITPALAIGQTTSRPVEIEGDVWTLLDTWLREGGPVESPTDGWALLETLFGTHRNTSQPSPEGWAHYLRAMGLTPTPEEQAALDSFRTTSPATAARLGDLAAEVGRAQTVRDATFDSLSPEQLHSLLHLAMMSRQGTLDESPLNALEAFDLAALARAARDLGQAADRAAIDLPAAAALDATLGEWLPPEARDTTRPLVPTEVVAHLARGASPATERASLDDAMLAWAILGGARPTHRPAPDDLQSPLANILAAAARATSGTPESQREFLATIAADLSPLSRAAYNLSVSTPGRKATMAGSPTPLSTLSSDVRSAVPTILREIAGPTSPPTEAQFSEGLSAFHDALGTPMDATQWRVARNLESRLGPDLSLGIGTLLLAQANYERDLSPQAPVPTAAARSWAAARPIVTNGTPLTAPEYQILAESVRAQEALSLLAALRAGQIVLAAQGIETPVPLPDAPTGPNDVLYSDALFMLTGVGTTRLDVAQRAIPPALLIDLGGDDHYGIPLAGVDLPEPGFNTGPGARTARTAISIDLGGNDTYSTGTPYAFGGARGAPSAPALGLLLDVNGRDRYHVNASAIGWAVDGFGIFVDLEGDDEYRATGLAFAGANSTSETSIAAGILLDALGNDRYETPAGFGSLGNLSHSHATASIFIDASGADIYRATCPSDPARACFGTPRADTTPRRCEESTVCTETSRDPTRGNLIFVDLDGQDEWPRPHDPMPFIDAGQMETRRLIIFDTTLADRDGDHIPDLIDQSEERDDLTGDSADTDGDGFPDALERVFGTDPNDPRSAPAGLARPPEPLTPEDLGPLEGAAGSNHLLNIPGLIGIGLPGPTNHSANYTFVLDLGFDDDAYTGRIASNGVAIDLGGDDRYHPRAWNGVVDPGLASASTGLAALLDLGGNDDYRAGALSLGYAGIGGIALFLDASGDDRTSSPSGSHAHALIGGVAIFVDGGGRDRHESLEHAVAGGTGAVAIFIEREGDDQYVRKTPLFPWTPTPQARAEAPGAAAFFLDTGGRDTHLIANATTGSLEPTPGRNNVFTAHTSPGASLYLDLGAVTENSDGDGISDPVEQAAGTDPENASEAPVASNSETNRGLLLNLPRLGIAIGDVRPSTYLKDYALTVDLGGADTYRNRAGASSPSWPVSLALDLGASADVYDHDNATPIEAFAKNADVAMTLGAGDLLVGSAQGAGVFGIGVLVDDGGTDTYRMLTRAEAECSPCDGQLAGIGQGAGLLGVGLLIHDGASTHLAHANVTTPPTSPGTVYAATFAQGASAVGVGLLWARSPMGDDYRVETSGFGAAVRRSTTGQGYALHGAGVLLDAGGSNRFEAQDRAQGAAEGAFPGMPSLLGVFRNASRSIGALLLPGLGGDTLNASSRSQAYASATAAAFLIDADGDDTRSLSGDAKQTGLGQAAAIGGGLALLADNRGNDRYQSNGSEVQGHAAGSIALLLDLAGSDTYSATTRSQGHATTDGTTVPGANTRVNAARATLGSLVDRTGNDRHELTSPNPVGQGSASRQIPDGNTDGPGPAVGLFLDAGGVDRYVGEPLSRTPLDTPRPRSGNDWSWRVTPTGTTIPILMGVGADSSAVPGAVATFEEALRPTAGAHVTLTDTFGENLDGPASGQVIISAALRARAGATTRNAPEPAIDRAEFYLNDALFKTARPISDGRVETSWMTNELDAAGFPRFPDGINELEARVHVRSGAAAEGTGAAVDTEPLTARITSSIDNAPLPRAPNISSNVSAAFGPPSLRLFVDRDLEQGLCVACDTPPIPAPPEPWAVEPSPDPYDIGQPDTLCVASPCSPEITSATGAGRTHLMWSPPLLEPENIVGYRVWFGAENGTFLGFVDARSPLRLVDASQSFVTGTYRIETLRVREGAVAFANTTHVHAANLAPAPVTGLRALGNEGGVHLTWNAAEGAQIYAIERAEPGIGWRSIGTTSGTFWIDALGLDTFTDTSYTYRVHALASSVRGLSSEVVGAVAAPGHRVVITIEHSDETPITLHDGPLGGGVTHDLALDFASIPDGPYLLRVAAHDARHENGTLAGIPVELDSTPPTTTTNLPGIVGGPHVSAGQLRIPYRVRDDGAGAVATMVMIQAGNGPWRAYGPLDPEAGVAAVPAPDDGVTVRLVAVSMDAAGNIEGLSGPRPFTPTLLDGARDAVASGRFSTHQLDLLPPVGGVLDQPTLVKIGNRARFVVTAADAGSGLAGVTLLIGPERIPMRQLSSDRFVADWTSTAAGTMQTRVEAIDRAANKLSLSLEVVIVDADAPQVHSAEVVFPGGRSAGRAGESASLRISASDDHSVPGDLVILANLSNISSRGSARASWDGAGTTFTLRDFLVDRLASTAEANITVDISDVAGNLRTINLTVRVDGERTTISVPTATGAPDSANISWTTPTALHGRVEYGESPQLGKKASSSKARAEQSVVLQGLRPATEYFARVYAITESGIETASDLFTFHTTDALLVEVRNANVTRWMRGPVPFEISVKRFDGAPVEAEIDAFLAGPRGAPQPVGRTTTTGAHATLTLDDGGLRDGVYEVVFHARVDDWKGMSSTVIVVVDRTAPILATRVPKALSAGEIVSLRFEEKGSGIDVAAATWMIGGTPCPTYLAGETISCRVPAFANETPQQVRVVLPDRAGNQAIVEFTAMVDSVSPVIASATVASPAGDPHLQPGGVASFVVRVSDATLRNVTIDLSAFGGPRTHSLHPIASETFAATFELPPSAKSATVTVHATDQGQRTSSADLMVFVDARPPRFNRTEVLATSPSSASLDTWTDEPTRLTIRIKGPDGERTIEIPDFRIHHNVPIDALRPTLAFDLVIIARDRAGHETMSTIEGRTSADLKAPGAVGALQLVDIGDGRFRLSWSEARDDLGISGYRIWRAVAGEPAVMLPLVQGLAMIDQAPVGVRVEYAVAAVDVGRNEGPRTFATGASQPIPHLSNGTVEPPLGGPGLYRFRVLVNLSSDEAAQVMVLVDGVEHSAARVDPNCRTECIHEATVGLGASTLAAGPHRYSFRATSGTFSTTFPHDGTLEGPTILGTASAPPIQSLSSAQRVPALGLLGVGLGVLVAVGATAVIAWKRRS